jgi:IMP dehydrogenase
MKVRVLLREKARPVITIAGDQPIRDAVDLMGAKKASALIVTEDNRPLGIFAERDVFRLFLKDRHASLSDIKLKDALTDQLIVADPEDESRHVMDIMIKAGIRHLPVMKQNKIIGMLTLEELIAHQNEALTDEIHHLKDYIEDLHEAGRD